MFWFYLIAAMICFSVAVCLYAAMVAFGKADEKFDAAMQKYYEEMEENESEIQNREIEG